MVIIRELQPGDIEHIAENIRPIDAKEALCMTGHSPIEAIKLSVDRSDAVRVAEYNSEPVAIFGIAPQALLSFDGVIWLVGTTNFKLVRKTFIKLSKETIEFLLTYYPTAVNYVLAENKETIKWLKWCGAELEAAVPYGKGKELFHRFALRRDA